MKKTSRSKAGGENNELFYFDRMDDAGIEPTLADWE